MNLKNCGNEDVTVNLTANTQFNFHNWMGIAVIPVSDIQALFTGTTDEPDCPIYTYKLFKDTSSNPLDVASGSEFISTTYDQSDPLKL